MAVKTYSMKRDGRNFTLSPNFQLYEFACNDKSDEVLVDDNLLEVLQQASNDLKRKITVTSGYRSKKYNDQIGGAKNSYHVRGQAADISIEGLTPWQVALYFEHYGNKKAKAIGMYDSWVHVDTRTTALYKYRKLKGKMGPFASTNNVETRTDTFGTKAQAPKPVSIAVNASNPASAGEVAALMVVIANKVQVNDKKALEAELTKNYNGSMYWVIKKLLDKIK